MKDSRKGILAKVCRGNNRMDIEIVHSVIEELGIIPRRGWFAPNGLTSTTVFKMDWGKIKDDGRCIIRRLVSDRYGEAHEGWCIEPVINCYGNRFDANDSEDQNFELY